MEEHPLDLAPFLNNVKSYPTSPRSSSTLRCDLEWLETMGLAFEPMPEREAAEVYEGA